MCLFHASTEIFVLYKTLFKDWPSKFVLRKQVHKVFDWEIVALSFIANALDSLCTPLFILENFIHSKHVVTSQNTEPHPTNFR